MKEKSVSQCKVKDRTLERHKGAAPTLTSATYKGQCANDILDACLGESKSETICRPPRPSSMMSSTLAPVPAGLFNSDANDRFTAGDTYDNNGARRAGCAACGVGLRLRSASRCRRAEPMKAREQESP